MEETYERQLAEIVAGMPGRPCVVALVPTIPLDQAAALASDLAQTIGALHGGHTVLTCFESAPSRLDHEIGVENCRGLTDVLSKRAAMSEVAAQGKARRFIYVPAGAEAAAGETLLRSPAWQALRGSATRGGGTVLAFVPSTVFVAAVEAWRAGEVEEPPFDALVWLGAANRTEADVREAATLVASVELGCLDLPDASSPGPPPGHRESEPEIGGEVATPEPAASRNGSGTPPVGPERAKSPPLQPQIVGATRYRRRARQPKRIGVVLFFVVLGMLGATLLYVLVTGPQPFVQQTAPVRPRR